MNARPPLPPGPYLIVGLARSGRAIAQVLHGRGEEVIGVDSGAVEGSLPIEVHERSDGVELLDRVGTVVKSPGVPRQSPVIAAALERGIEVVGELEVAWRLLPNPFVAVTGTNGKTTTVELLGAIWREAGLPVEVAGNVGRPLASLVGELDPLTTIVAECSSFQLEDATAFAPECAVVLNVEEDHLDRHGDLTGYTAAKARVFANQGAEDVAVYPSALESMVGGEARRVRYDEQWSQDGETSHFRDSSLPTAGIRLRGAHNLENIAAAATAADELAVPREALLRALRTFAGVPNRLEEVGRPGGVLYVNDSKATNPASAIRGIRAFSEGVHVILGGSLKGGDFKALRDAVTERCEACYLIGPAAEQIAADLGGTVPLEPCGTLEKAVERASVAARPGDVVLLSPACASFDAYRDYEQRGDDFRRLTPAAE